MVRINKDGDGVITKKYLYFLILFLISGCMGGRKKRGNKKKNTLLCWFLGGFLGHRIRLFNAQGCKRECVASTTPICTLLR